ncbi:IPT/TIG domain-containing protein [Candidatus Parcubacteria bacterium]|nr:IPT/TIG domain-containing protein [Candidatus Parcubacteria bacterium]
MKAKKVSALILILTISFALGIQAQINNPFCPTLTQDLYVGVRDSSPGGQVTQLQTFLNNKYGQPVTGYFGTVTRYNVVRFQAEVGLPQVGRVGPLTRASIAKVCGGTTTGPVSISSLVPTQGLVGAQVTITGSGFTATDNTVHFGYGVVTNLTSVDTTHITFNVPSSLNPACFYSTPACLIPSQITTPGNYSVSVSNANGQSNSQTFAVTTGTQTQNATIRINNPNGGETVSSGQNLNISWTSNNAPSQSALVLDLYSVAGVKVGTIAVSSNTTSSSTWRIPTGGTVCTLQFPNGLCGQSLSGQYYIEGSLVSGSGFDPSPTVYYKAVSGNFTIN